MVVVELLAVAPPAGDVVAVPPPVFFTVVVVDNIVVEVPGMTGPLGSVVTTGSTTPPPEPPDPASAGEVVEVAPDTVVVEPDTVVVVDGTVVVVDGAVVVVAFAVHTAYRVSPPPGIVIAWLFEYDVPVPADVVSHRDSVKPDRVNNAPLLSVTVAPEAAYCVEMDPVPPFELYETAGRASHTAYRVSPPPGIVIDWLFEYGVPVPADVVSHRDNTYPVREKPEPLLRVTVVPDTPVVAEIDPVPPFEL